MADLLDFAPVRVFTSNAAPGAGYIARFYQSGTTTPVTVFANSSLSTPLGTSVTADAEGKFVAVFSAGGAIKATIETPTGAVVATVDPARSIPASASAAGSITFAPTVQLPFTNVQEAIEGAADRTLSRATAVSASGTSVDFTGIPSWARRVTVLFNVISTNGTSNVMVQLGDAGGFETSGYSGSASGLFGGGGQTAWSNGALVTNSNAATVVISGAITIQNLSSNLWVFDGSVGRSDATPGQYVMSGVKTLSDVLTQIRVTTAGGVDTFDAGTLNVMWE